VFMFPDWETLPYDKFSPHQDIISSRLYALNLLGNIKKGILIVPVTTMMHYICPKSFLKQQSAVFEVGQKLNITQLREEFQHCGYYLVSEVMSHGEYAIRGSIIDVFPMGANLPIRIDLFDDEIDTLRWFDPKTQLSKEKTQRINLLPAREYPLTAD